MATITTVLEVPYLCTDRNRHIVLVYRIGNSLTHYLGLNGCTLSVMKDKTVEFEREYRYWEKDTALDFAKRYTLTEKGRLFIGLTGAAYRVLKAILSNQGMSDVDYPQTRLDEMESHMAKKEVADTGFP